MASSTRDSFKRISRAVWQKNERLLMVYGGLLSSTASAYMLESTWYFLHIFSDDKLPPN